MGLQNYITRFKSCMPSWYSWCTKPPEVIKNINVHVSKRVQASRCDHQAWLFAGTKWSSLVFNTTSHYQPYTFIHPLIQGPFQNLSPAINTLLKAYALIHQAIIFPSTAMTCHLFTRPNCWKRLEVHEGKWQEETARAKNDQNTIYMQKEIQNWLYSLFLHT